MHVLQAYDDEMASIEKKKQERIQKEKEEKERAEEEKKGKK